MLKDYHGKPLEMPNWREVVYNRLNIIGNLTPTVKRD